MAMSHKAFLFDWRGFERELAPILHASLANGQDAGLVEFCNRHLAHLRDPYEGEPLAADWLAGMETGDVQEIADFMLTRYYDPTADEGVGDAWFLVSSGMDERGRAALLGEPFGPPEALFDPGGMGAYFQPPETCRESRLQLRRDANPRLAHFKGLLDRAVGSGEGVYVTF